MSVLSVLLVQLLSGCYTIIIAIVEFVVCCALHSQFKLASCLCSLHAHCLSRRDETRCAFSFSLLLKSKIRDKRGKK